MICQRCQENPATVHLTKIEQKKKVEFHLCDTCAGQQGVPSSELSLDDLLDEPADDAVTALPEVPPEEGIPPCPSCGLTLATFRTTGRLGCPEDYEHFKRALVPLIEKIHSSSQHVGKVPLRMTERLERQKLLEGLKREQERSIKEENYEKAAELRDRIKLLEDEMGSP